MGAPLAATECGAAPESAVAGSTSSPLPAPKIVKQYKASIYGKVPVEFEELIQKIQAHLGMPVWLLVQNSRDPNWGEISKDIYSAIHAVRGNISEGKPAAILIESPGGDAHEAYRIARLFQRRASEFVVIVPQYAKSAATLLSLAASRLILGRDSELGPLDVQMADFERESWGSALDAVQALE